MRLSPVRQDAAPAVSVVLCTFNRAGLLGGALDALVAQTAETPPYEVVVVDNNSTDGTPAVVGQFAPTGRVRYEFEPEQGLSAARNRGIAVARAPLLAFTDDDVRVDPSWVRTIAETFEKHPDVDMIGGKVQPEWEAPPPNWLPEAGLAPLAVLDYGDQTFRVTSERPVCLVGANLSVRREALERVGLFSTALQRVGNGIGSTEDQDLELRLLASGRAGLYEPRLRVRALVPRDRLSKRYHRTWHKGHGRFYAMMRDPSFEQTTTGTVLGVPAHVYREVARELGAWAHDILRFERSAAFRHELRLRFLTAFAWHRIFGSS